MRLTFTPDLLSEVTIDIRNEDCFETMEAIEPVDVVLTSPPYNTNKKAGKNRVIGNTNADEYIRYDVFVDNFTDDEYTDFTRRLFLKFDKILKPNGCVLYNISYGAENTDGMFKAINAIICDTPFSIADVIVWKKSNAFPNSVSPNRLTRTCEFVFVLCRETEKNSFNMNKNITSYRETGQPAYENLTNLIEARNNDGACPVNKATYSSELCEKLLCLYSNKGMTIYDPFMGSGTTAIACMRMGCNCIGSEISEAQCKYAEDRIQRYLIGVGR